ncbi:hypothetical protein BaRGS_00014092 [Batillaria attramentaria]|uniref:Uncharacterized protein n=1 Tax=Batillaria attramentaria TaxID=370345 RepID=A0ABD0L6M2_9CAEN
MKVKLMRLSPVLARNKMAARRKHAPRLVAQMSHRSQFAAREKAMSLGDDDIEEDIDLLLANNEPAGGPDESDALDEIEQEYDADEHVGEAVGEGLSNIVKKI